MVSYNCMFIFPVGVSIDKSELHTAQTFITSMVTLILKKFSILYGTEGFFTIFTEYLVEY